MYIWWVRVWYVHKYVCTQKAQNLDILLYPLESKSLIEPGDHQAPASLLFLLPTTLGLHRHIITLGILQKSWGFELRSPDLRISCSFSLSHYLQCLKVHYKISAKNICFMTLTTMYTFVIIIQNNIQSTFISLWSSSSSIRRYLSLLLTQMLWSLCIPQTNSCCLLKLHITEATEGAFVSHLFSSISL